MWMSDISPADRACWNSYWTGGGWWLDDEKPRGPYVTGIKPPTKEEREALEARWAVYDAVWDEELRKAGGDTAVALRECLRRRGR